MPRSLIYRRSVKRNSTEHFIEDVLFDVLEHSGEPLTRHDWINRVPGGAHKRKMDAIEVLVSAGGVQRWLAADALGRVVFWYLPANVPRPAVLVNSPDLQIIRGWGL